MCDLETSRMGAPYIYDISRLRVNPVRFVCTVTKNLSNLQSAIGPQTTEPILDNRSQISVITWKQTPSLQSNSQASLDPWNPTVGNCIKLKSRDTRVIPVKSATHNNRCSMVYA